MVKEFKEFALRGNVIDMAVGIIIGAAFGAIVKSLVDDVLMPPVGLLLGGVDFANLFFLLKAGSPPPPYLSLADARAAGAVTVNYGMLINTLVNFLAVAAAMFILVRSLNRLKREEKTAPAEPITRECPFCLSTIPARAIRCPHCTSRLQE
jgi:large conductance mechanosensitive channel